MLILSRQKSQKIKFPELDITIHIMDVRGSRVRLGVDAPLEVRVLRHELEEFEGGKKSAGCVVRLPSELRHELRNALNEVGLMLHVLRRKQEQLPESDDPETKQFDAKVALDMIVQKLQDLAAHSALASDDEQGATQQPPQVAPGGTLLVEDNDNERELLAGFLRMSGQSVSTASDGAEALEYLNRKTAPDVIILDMEMPRCDGATVIRRVRRQQRFNSTQIYVTSGRTPREAGVDKKSDRYDRWFQKPFDPRSLADALSAPASHMSA